MSSANALEEVQRAIREQDYSGASAMVDNLLAQEETSAAVLARIRIDRLTGDLDSASSRITKAIEKWPNAKDDYLG